jgi:hypothetical protein
MELAFMGKGEKWLKPEGAVLRRIKDGRQPGRT